RGVRCGADQVVLLNSSQQAVDVTARLLLDPGDAVAMETPARLGAVNAFRVNGGRIVPVPTDRDGMLVDRLPDDPRVRLVYVSPSHLWPTGATLPLARRLRLLEWAARRGVWILEHDHNAEYGNWRTPVVSLQGLDDGRRVIYAGTFSRLLSPDPEIAYLVVPPHVAAGFRAAKALGGNWSTLLAMEALAIFLEEGHMQSLLRRLERHLRPLRACLFDAIEAMPGRPLVPTAGTYALHVHATLRDFPVDRLDELVDACTDEGVGVFPDTPYHLRKPRRAGILLGFARMTPETIREGIRRLDHVLAGTRPAFRGGA
ncbi:PLP-dependent aminotransferase family protein, partial [bacterium]|nr:PLP-dependent aminotransferase family protein [bacterium]